MWYIPFTEAVAEEEKLEMQPFTDGSIKTDTPKFTHLKVYSSYSLGIGLNTPAEICAHARQLGYASVAITDTQGTYGFIEFHLAAKKYGIKPIYGVIVDHSPVSRPGEERFALGLLATSRKGLRHIAALASLSAETGVAPGIEMLSVNSADVVAFIGAADSEINKLLLQGDEENARRVAGVFKEVFRDRLFIEIQDHGAKEERTLAGKLLALAEKTRTASLLTHEVRYVEKGMRDFYGTIRGIRHPAEERGFFRADQRVADWSMRSPVEVSQLRPFYESAYDNTARVDEMIPGDLLDEIDREGVGGERFSQDVVSRGEIIERCMRVSRQRNGKLSNADTLRYRAILEEEVDQVLSEGLGPTLFLFHRVLSRLREAGVELGPATGLGLQSLCAHLLGITSFDPYRYDSGFHPFFDSRAREAGEFELQLTGETRANAAHELVAMFGVGEVAYLPAIERVTPAKAVRMAASVVDASEGELEEIHKIVARHPGVSIGKLYELDRNAGRLYRQSVAVRDLLTRAALLEELPLGVVRSRRSLALSAIPLTDFLGHSIDSETGDLFVQAGRDNFPVAHIYRVDITSLSALSVAVRSDRELRKAKIADYGWERFPLDDREVWDGIQSGDTTGIFLFEGPATLQQREYFELRSIDDLVNFLALMRLRDGDQSLAQRFSAFLSESVEPVPGSEEIAPILAVTRGHILYQEQLRDIICVLAGKPPLEAWKMVHDLRSPSPGVLSTVRSRFMMGAAERNVSLETANQWFERLLYHSKTAISRKRVFADALLVYKLFFLKTRHEASFYAALLNSNAENEGKLAKYLAPLREREMVLEVDVNRSDVEFSVENGKIRVGLCAVPGLGVEMAERIVKVRAKGEFDSLEQFARKVGTKHIGRDDIRRLIDAGAFDSGEVGRADLSKNLTALFGRRRARAKPDGKGQLELPFDA